MGYESEYIFEKSRYSYLSFSLVYSRQTFSNVHEHAIIFLKTRKRSYAFHNLSFRSVSFGYLPSRGLEINYRSAPFSLAPLDENEFHYGIFSVNQVWITPRTRIKAIQFEGKNKGMKSNSWGTFRGWGFKISVYRVCPRTVSVCVNYLEGLRNDGFSPY